MRPIWPGRWRSYEGYTVTDGATTTQNVTFGVDSAGGHERAEQA